MQFNWWEIYDNSLLHVSPVHLHFLFFPGSNSSDWLRSVHGGDDFWSCWYSLVFQWLGGMWQMCLKGRTPCYHVRITPHSLWRLCAPEPLIACWKHSQIRGALLTEAFCSLLGSGALWVSARFLLEPIQIKRVMIHPVFAFLDWWALCFHWSSWNGETWGEGNSEDVNSQGLWLSQGQNAGAYFGCGTALKDILHRQAVPMEDSQYPPFFFCVVFDVTPLNVICRIDSTSLRLRKAEYEQG